MLVLRLLSENKIMGKTDGIFRQNGDTVCYCRKASPRDRIVLQTKHLLNIMENKNAPAGMECVQS